MLTGRGQRWLFSAESWRVVDEPVRAREWEVVRLQKDAEAKAFIEAHHYAGTYTAARERFALVHSPTLQTMGVAVFDVPAQPRCLDVLPGEAAERLHFGRLVLLASVPGNGESLFIGECFRQLRREGYTGVVSFADPLPRSRLDGGLIHPGHVGIVYQSTSGRLVGRSRADCLWLLPDGSALHRRAMAKVRALEQGWRYVCERLIRFGATPLPPTADEAAASAWLDLWRARLCRPVQHPGNFKYVWGLTRAATRHLERTTVALAYPRISTGRAPPKWGRKTEGA